jgi:hypothetical protein
MATERIISPVAMRESLIHDTHSSGNSKTGVTRRPGATRDRGIADHCSLGPSLVYWSIAHSGSVT